MSLSNRTFGVEIEHGNPWGWLGVASELQREHPMWAKDVHQDGSGVEVVSPILCGNDGLAEFKAVLEFLQKIGGTMGPKDGFHVHHGGKDFLRASNKAKTSRVTALLKSWCNNQPTVNQMLPDRRNKDMAINGIRFCKVLDKDRTEGLIKFVKSSEFTVGDPCINADGEDNQRFYALNVQALLKYGTIEVRQHHGTWEFDRLAAWIEFGQKFIERSRDVGEIQPHSTVPALLGELGMEDDAIMCLRRKAT